MLNKKREYNSNLLKGTGLIQEMMVLIDAWDPLESRPEFIKRVIGQDLLGKSTDNRIKDLVSNIFSDRFLGYPIPIVEYLKAMRANYVSLDVISQLYYIYTCRANLILEDFVKDFYFQKVDKGVNALTASDPKGFIREALKDGRIERSWSESTINKVSQHIIATLIDFKLIERNKTILPFRLIDLSANYMAHELHFLGYSDNEIWHHADWALFGLSDNDVIRVLERLANKGTFIMQFSGELMHISWNYSNMTEFIENECRY